MLANLNNLFFLSTQAQEYLRYFLGLILITLILNTVACFEGSVIFISSVVPVVTYSNSDTMKESVVKENKGKSGVYRWTNKITGYTYIGSSVDLAKRFRNYYKYSFLSHDKTMVIHRALLKYGYSNFMLEILEYCIPEDVLSREQHYFDTLKPEYNILKVAGSRAGQKHTEETLSKLRLHLNQLNEGKGFKVEIFDLVSNTLNTFKSVREAAKSINMVKGTLLNNEKKNLGKDVPIPIKKRYLVKIFRNTETVD